MKLAFLLFAFAMSLFFAEFIMELTAFAQSGAPTGTLVNPSVPNGVESNPTTFENTQPVLGATPPPVAKLKPKKHLPPGNSKLKEKNFVAPPDAAVNTNAPEPRN